MKKIRKFQCKTGVRFERFVDDETPSVKCDCGEIANKVISAARYFSNTTGKSPSAKSY